MQIQYGNLLAEKQKMDDSRDMAENLLATLAIVRCVMPHGTTPQQAASIQEVEMHLQQAVGHLKTYINLRNGDM